MSKLKDFELTTSMKIVLVFNCCKLLLLLQYGARLYLLVGLLYSSILYKKIYLVLVNISP